MLGSCLLLEFVGFLQHTFFLFFFFILGFGGYVLRIGLGQELLILALCQFHKPWYQKSSS